MVQGYQDPHLGSHHEWASGSLKVHNPVVRYSQSSAHWRWCIRAICSSGPGLWCLLWTRLSTWHTQHLVSSAGNCKKAHLLLWDGCIRFHPGMNLLVALLPLRAKRGHNHPSEGILIGSVYYTCLSAVNKVQIYTNWAQHVCQDTIRGKQKKYPQDTGSCLLWQHIH